MDVGARVRRQGRHRLLPLRRAPVCRRGSVARHRQRDSMLAI